MLTLDICAPDSGAVTPHPLGEGEFAFADITLRALPGTRDIEVVVRQNEIKVLMAEVGASPGAYFRVRIQRSDSDEWLALAPEARRLLRYAPGYSGSRCQPLRTTGFNKIDLAVLVDGTCRRREPVVESQRTRWETSFLLDSVHAPELWVDIATRVETFAENLRAVVPDIQVAVLAFADTPVPRVTNVVLNPKYLFDPKDGKAGFETLSSGSLRSRLLRLRSSSGGDFVDALADGLKACAYLDWRSDARRLLLLLGDSPGYSVLEPLPAALAIANAQTRILDVDTQAEVLHARGVEIISLLHPAPVEAFGRSDAGDYLRYTEDQYRGLASLPEYFFDTATFNGAAAASAVVGAPAVLGRGSYPGVLASAAK